jgi:hypothetical protein
VRVGAVEKDGSSSCRDGGCLQTVSGNRGLRGSPIEELKEWGGGLVVVVVVVMVAGK